VTARLKKNEVQQVKIQHFLGDELLDTSPPPSNEDALEVVSGDEAGRLLRLGVCPRIHLFSAEFT
jgi:hypothetical protein